MSDRLKAHATTESPGNN